MPDDSRATSSLDDSTAESPGTAPDRPTRSSRRWLWAAVVVTIVGIVVVGALFMGLAPGGSATSGTQQDESSAVSGGEPLVVAVARTPGGPTEWANWARVIKEMSEELGVPVSVRYLAKEEEAATVIASEDIDVAFLCANNYLRLRDEGVMTGLCSPVIDGDHMTTSMIVVSAEDDAECLEDLEGAVVAASDKSSLGGVAYLTTACDALGATPEEYFAEVRMGETQEANMRDLLDGSVRATVINSAQVAAWDLSGFKVVERSRPFGTPPVAVAADMDPELTAQIREFLLSFDSETLPEESNIGGFVALDDADYEFAEILRYACGDHTHP